MKKSNLIVFALVLIVSIFLLGLWYHLGFSDIDNPTDLMLSVIWWIGIALIIGAIVKVEKTRCERTRTCYVASDMIFNSEKGSLSLSQGISAVERIQDILVDLKYGLKIEEVPSRYSTQFATVVRTTAFKAHKNDNGNVTVDEWTGNVSFVARPNDKPMEFRSREQLAAILAGEYVRPSSSVPTSFNRPAVAMVQGIS